MKWHVQNDAGYGGYNGTPAGDLKVTNLTNPGQENGSGTYNIDWTFPDGQEFIFQLTISKPDSNGNSTEQIEVKNDTAQRLLNKIMYGDSNTK